MSRRIVYLDFETFWDQDYTLSKMDPIQYVMDPRLQIHGAALAIDGGPSVWLANDASGGPEAFARVLDTVVPPEAWANSAVCAWNCRFDASLLFWRVGRKPAAYIDPMAMARALLGHLTPSVSLDACAKIMGLPPKHAGVLASTRGLSTQEIILRGLMGTLGAYGVHDTDLCRTMFLRMSKALPVSEMLLVDQIVRIFVEPSLRLDPPTLSDVMTATAEKREALIQGLGVSPTQLRSDAQFADQLRATGIEIPMKRSPTTGAQVFAFAKTDLAFTAIADDENMPDRARALVQARLGVKSSQEETRAQRLLDISKVNWPAHMAGQSFLPVPLSYYAAHTGRLGGDMRINLQNLGRDSAIRDAVAAPPGHVVLTADSAQIEARMTAWLAGEEPLVTAFARGEDVYSLFASEVYGYQVVKSKHPDERFLGKTSILGLGFGMSAPKFQHTVAYQSKGKIVLDESNAVRVVTLYRRTYPKIPMLWKRCEAALEAIAHGNTDFKIGPVRVARQGLDLPNGTRLHYRGLEYDGRSWSYLTNQNVRRNLWHGMVCENIVQALARICVTDSLLRIIKRPDYRALSARFVLTVHDELVFTVPTAHADALKRIVLAEMSVPPAWGTGLPLAAEAGAGLTYGDAK